MGGTGKRLRLDESPVFETTSDHTSILGDKLMALFLLGLAIVAASGSVALGADRLKGQANPYLSLHAKDPIDWHPWGPEALKKARDTRKPIFLSIGFLACHWCHVLQKESFSDRRLAQVINRRFIPIMVDRERRPDIDQIYQRAAKLLGSQTGWPLNLFLTPEGTPFFAVGYLPNTPRAGLPSFSHVVHRVSDQYRRDPKAILANADRIRKRLAEYFAPKPGDVSWKAIFGAITKLERDIDLFHGGFGTAPKFPRFAALELMWRGHLRSGDQSTGKKVIDTLTAIINGGIYDHLGGGLARYATDPQWKVPHFEKLLSTNARFLNLMIAVWRETRSRILENRIRQTIGFALAELKLKGGGFVSAIDAGTNGKEGVFYVWSAEEIDRILVGNAKLFRHAYGVTASGNWHGGKSILHRSEPSNLRLASLFGGSAEDISARLEASRRRLKTHRDKRRRPMRDDKILADWNGAMISAIAEAGLAFGEPRWVHAAEETFAAIRGRLQRPEGLFHLRPIGGPPVAASLDDYAQLARAAITLFEATGKRAYLENALSWTRGALQLWDRRRGGFYHAHRISLVDLPRARSVLDRDLPSGNATMVEVMVRLYHLTGNNIFLRRADHTIRAFFRFARAKPLRRAGILAAADTFLAATQVIFIGRRSDPQLRRLLDAVWRTPIPGRVAMVLAPGTVLSKGHPARYKTQVDGRATAYVCRAQLCSLPATTQADLRSAMRLIRLNR